MNKETRIQKIQETIDLQKKQSDFQKKPLLQQEIIWDSDLQSMTVYKIPLEYLIYNKYNGRILSRMKSLESQGKEIDAETDKGRQIIEDLLWYSKEERNKKTKIDLEKNEQLKVGIITRDGIIIDGNRRAMLLNKINREGKIKNRDYFKAIVLPVTLEENPIEIEKLETSYQMGEDEKLDYNPIEKYLKSKGLNQRGISTAVIADWMGEDKSVIEEYLSVMESMDDYLDFLDYNGVYTQLDGREDQFISLTKWLSNFYGGGSTKAFDGYRDCDVDDLKTIAFDYIRVKYEGKKFRNIAHGQRQNHFFGNKQIWDSFKDKHFQCIDPLREEEEGINLDSENLTSALNGRDEKFKEKTQDLLDENLDTHCTKLRNQKEKDEPAKLISKAIDSMSAINKRSKEFEKPEVLNQVERLNQITTEMIREKSPKMALKQVFDLLVAIDLREAVEDKEEILSFIKDIEREAYQMEKDVKHLK